MAKGFKRISLIGVEVDVFSEKELLHSIIDTSCHEKSVIVGHHNLHSIWTCYHDDKMRVFYKQAKYIYIDGMPIIWIGRLFSHKINKKHRLTSLDWIIKFLQLCHENDRNVFLLGSKPGVAEKAVDVFNREIPGLKLRFHHGYFNKDADSPENMAVLHAINSFNTHVLLVGMGMPIQENWIAENINRLNVNVAWALGAYMDYFAGVKPLPPRWMGRIGLEWLSRLCCEPSRLWRRYLIEPWFILFLIARYIIQRLLTTQKGVTHGKLQ